MNWMYFGSANCNRIFSVDRQIAKQHMLDNFRQIGYNKEQLEKAEKVLPV